MDESGGGGNPLIADRQDTTTWATGLWLVEDIQQAAGGISSGSWVDASIGTAMVGLDALGVVVDPIGSLVSMGVGWLMEHVQPLSDALDWLAGDPDQITAYAQTWGNVATQAGDAATDLTDAVQREVAPWTGVAAGAYRGHAGDQVTALDGIAKAAAGIGEAVQGAAQLVATVRTIVRDLIAECVATLAARLPQWLAMEGFTLGIATPVVVSQVTALVSRWVSRITRFLDGLIRSIANLIPLLRRLGDLIGELKALLARLARTDPTAPRMTDQTRDGLRHSDADPLRAHGPAHVTHPEAWDNALREAEELGVEVIFREGSMAYSPGLSPGQPGQLILDPDASYGALLHEMRHLRDDHAAGWGGMRGMLENPYARYQAEARAYQEEIDYALSIGDNEAAERLRELLEQERLRIFGEAGP